MRRARRKPGIRRSEPASDTRAGMADSLSRRNGHAPRATPNRRIQGDGKPASPAGDPAMSQVVALIRGHAAVARSWRLLDQLRDRLPVFLPAITRLRQRIRRRDRARVAGSGEALSWPRSRTCWRTWRAGDGAVAIASDVWSRCHARGRCSMCRYRGIPRSWRGLAGDHWAARAA